jgi:hypothetical protein
MHATNVAREPRRRSRMLPWGTAAAALLVIGLVIALVARSGDDAPATAQAPAAKAADIAASARAEEVATRFLEAFGAFDLKKMTTYLAEDASIASMGAQDDPRLLVSYLEVTGYRQTLGSCEEQGNPGSGSVRCPYDFHALRSAELGRGPFTGSAFELTVRDGKIVHVAQGWEIEDFSPRVWEPFADWVSKAHPRDVAVMYTDGCCNVRLTEKSIRLWEQNTQGYVDDVKRNRRKASRASSVRSG